MKRKSRLCALCLKRRTRARRPALAAALHAALITCCHLWIPAPDDPICEECKNFYRNHLREHDATAAGYGKKVCA